MLLASLASYITVRTKIAGRGIIEGLVFIPWAFPGTAMALGLLWAYVDFPIPIYATIWIILIAYVTRFLPYGMRAVSSTIIQVHKELEEASIACGAGFLGDFRRVLIPMMRPGVIAGWIILSDHLSCASSAPLCFFTAPVPSRWARCFIFSISTACVAGSPPSAW